MSKQAASLSLNIDEEGKVAFVVDIEPGKTESFITMVADLLAGNFTTYIRATLEDKLDEEGRKQELALVEDGFAYIHDCVSKINTKPTQIVKPVDKPIISPEMLFVNPFMSQSRRKA